MKVQQMLHCLGPVTKHMRIKRSEISKYRHQILTEQEHKCALCGEIVVSTEAVLDHDHKTGYIRGTLHRGCNAFLGKLENSLAMNKITPERLHTILGNIEFYMNSHRLLVHPTHLTAEERKERTKRRAKLRRKRASK